jgi:hypothetical protein
MKHGSVTAVSFAMVDSIMTLENQRRLLGLSKSMGYTQKRGCVRKHRDSFATHAIRISMTKVCQDRAVDLCAVVIP